MKPEKQRLLNDLLNGSDAPDFNESVLCQANHLLRSKRRRVAVARSLALVAVMSLGLAAWHALRPSGPELNSEAAPLASSFQPHRLTDDELLDLFPNTPVGLATVDGKQRLIFPRPGDEERLVIRF